MKPNRKPSERAERHAIRQIPSMSVDLSEIAYGDLIGRYRTYKRILRAAYLAGWRARARAEKKGRKG